MTRYESRVGRIEADITTFRILSRMSWVATKLYNTALWNARETWKMTGKIPSGFTLQKTVFASPFHTYLPAHTYQHPAHEVGNAFKAWFKLRKTDKTANPPGFRRKESQSTLMFDAFKKVGEGNSTFLMTLGESMREELSYPNKRMLLKVNWNTPFPLDGELTQINIIPRGGYFEMHAKIILPEPVWRTEGHTLAVDLGMRNPMVTMDDLGRVDVFKGGAIASSLHYWNKEKARVQAEVMGRTKGKKKHSKALNKMAKRGAAQVRHAVHALTDAFANLCNERNIKEVVVGDLGGIKKEADGSGKKWNSKCNQNWQQFPIQTLVEQAGYKLARFGIRLVKQDERGTSKCRCSLCGCTDRSKLHRVKRGLFHCSNCDTKQNADVNGVGNQLVRYLRLDTLPSVSSIGCLAQPLVWRWDNHRWMEVSQC